MATPRRKLPQHAQNAIDRALEMLGQIERKPEQVYRLLGEGKNQAAVWELGVIRSLAQKATREVESIEVEGREG